MNQPNPIMFPATIQLLGITILAHLISRHTILCGNFTLRNIPLRWIYVLLIFIWSWLFLFTSGILLLGFGLERNHVSCSVGVFLCIIFYGSSKFFTYGFLSERVHAVWQSPHHPRRLQCKAYIVCIITLFGFCGVAAVLFYGRISYIDESTRTCYIGLKQPVSITLLTYDFFVNALFTGLLLWPAMRSSPQKAKARDLAARTLWPALVALTISCVNVLVLTLMYGREPGWVCFGSCGTDVTINALAIYWVTPNPSDKHESSSEQEQEEQEEQDPKPARTAPPTNPKPVFKLEQPRKHSPPGLPTLSSSGASTDLDTGSPSRGTSWGLVGR
ncbi:hypothetical protein BDM02DRAFT_589138 [Thelephora ganbajun]|uniref:Uncharacterized protein n=1 Tax=Thelephora ganbajun TaxID=370292 RepID=A0ACB6Z733_THEGA|nr:hypothetical protein BDM02DRAFT_589138 [Thelephora ganbajun]